MNFQKNWLLALAVSSALVGCKGSDPEPEENEFISTVQLVFTPAAGGNAITATWRDLDGEGGTTPTVTPINLARNTTYNVAIKFLNETVSPADDITKEIQEEADEHLVVFTPAPANLVQFTVTDRDSRNLPIGLASRAVTTAAGTGTLQVVLRHQPPVNGQPIKNGTATPGSTDAEVTFNVAIQ